MTPGDLCAPRPGLPTADPRMLHGYLGDVVRVLDPTTEADPVGVYVTLLATFGACLSPRQYTFAGARQTPRLWPLLIGPTGSGRKGTTWSVVREFFNDARGDHFLRHNLVHGGLSTGEGLVGLVRDRPDEVERPGKGRVEQPSSWDRYDDKRRLIVEPEFARLLATSRRDGNTLSPLLRAAWETGDLNVVTRTDPLVATGAHIVLVGHVTARELRAKVTDSDIGGGLLNRFMPFLVRQSKDLPLEPDGDADTRSRLAAEWPHRVNAAHRRNYVRRSPEGDALWRDHLYGALKVPEAEEESVVGELLVRGHAYVMRVALLLALIDDSPSIGPEHLLAAAALWSYSSACTRAVWAGTGEGDADKLARHLAAAADEGVTRSQASRLFSGHRSSDDIDKLLEGLVAEGRAKETTRSTGGRPAKVYVWCGPAQAAGAAA